MPSEGWLANVGLKDLHKKQSIPLRSNDFLADLDAKIVELLRRCCPDLGVETASIVPSPRQPAKPEIPPGYLDRVREDCADVGLLGLKLQQGQAVKLNHVYVPLATHAREWDKRGKESQPHPVDEERRGSPALLLDLLDKESLYVSGDSGLGEVDVLPLGRLAGVRRINARNVAGASRRISRAVPRLVRRPVTAIGAVARFLAAP